MPGSIKLPISVHPGVAWIAGPDVCLGVDGLVRGLRASGGGGGVVGVIQHRGLVSIVVACIGVLLLLLLPGRLERRVADHGRTAWRPRLPATRSTPDPPHPAHDRYRGHRQPACDDAGVGGVPRAVREGIDGVVSNCSSGGRCAGRRCGRNIPADGVVGLGARCFERVASRATRGARPTAPVRISVLRGLAVLGARGARGRLRRCRRRRGWLGARCRGWGR